MPLLFVLLFFSVLFNFFLLPAKSLADTVLTLNSHSIFLSFSVSLLYVGHIFHLVCGQWSAKTLTSRLGGGAGEYSL